MIITRSPLRISLGGGGTDLPSYYRRHSGFLIAAAIDKYVYITLHQTFQKGLIIKYSKMEQVEKIEQVQHPIIRETLKFVQLPDPNLEIASMADIPAGTGLGSSGSFTTALLKALHIHQKRLVPTHELAEQACMVEIEKVGSKVGKQDQYIAAYGGIACFQFLPNDQVQVSPLKMDSQTLYNLEDNLLMFFTGYSRSASSILKDQDDKSKQQDAAMIDNLHFMKDLAYKSKEALEGGDLRAFASYLHVHWEHKRQRGSGMSNSDIDGWYDLAIRNGALGGKLVGAGGGGFLLFYSEEKTRLRQAMAGAGLREVRFRFDFEGTRAVAQ
jgi:D-glycero-alpha-D-manno-heptose-7-phosphate kinase